MDCIDLYSLSRHNLFCKLKSKFSATRLHVPDVPGVYLEKKICSYSYIVNEAWESYSLEFVLILFEDSGFLIYVNYSLLLSSNKSSNKRQLNALLVPNTFDSKRQCVETGIHNSGKEHHTGPGHKSLASWLLDMSVQNLCFCRLIF